MWPHLCTAHIFTVLNLRWNSLQFCIAKCDFWFVWHFSREIWHKVMSHDPALLAKMLLLYPNMIPWPITNSPAYCELFHNSLTWIFYNLFSIILPLSQLFWNVLQPSKTKFVHIYKIHLHWSVKTLEIFSLYFCQLNKSWRELTNHRFLILLHFTKHPKCSGIGVVEKQWKSSMVECKNALCKWPFRLLHYINTVKIKPAGKVNTTLFGSSHPLKWKAWLFMCVKGNRWFSHFLTWHILLVTRSVRSTLSSLLPTFPESLNN